MNYTPKVRQKKSNFWGVFIMKLSYDDKVQIYELRKQGYSLEKLSNKFGINNSNIRYMIKLIDRYGWNRHSKRSTTRIRFSIVTKAGNTNTILIIAS
ncbi:transposase InsK for insertion sequence [Streptococcus pneumoniae]|nr:transposase InsK for insertion sequence [Streptococcus pneumoniae]